MKEESKTDGNLDQGGAVLCWERSGGAFLREKLILEKRARSEVKALATYGILTGMLSVGQIPGGTTGRKRGRMKRKRKRGETWVMEDAMGVQDHPYLRYSLSADVERYKR